MEKEAFYNPIREHIFSVPGLIGDELGRIFEEAKNSAACGLRELMGRSSI